MRPLFLAVVFISFHFLCPRATTTYMTFEVHATEMRQLYAVPCRLIGQHVAAAGAAASESENQKRKPKTKKPKSPNAENIKDEHKMPNIRHTRLIRHTPWLRGHRAAFGRQITVTETKSKAKLEGASMRLLLLLFLIYASCFCLCVSGASVSARLLTYFWAQRTAIPHHPTPPHTPHVSFSVAAQTSWRTFYFSNIFLELFSSPYTHAHTEMCLLCVP